MFYQLGGLIAQFAKDVDQINKPLIIFRVGALDGRYVARVTPLELWHSFRMYGSQEMQPAGRIVGPRFPGMEDAGQPAAIRVAGGMQPAMPVQQSRVHFLDKVWHGVP